MGRFYISLALLAAILGVCTFSLHQYSTAAEEMTAQLDRIEQAALSGEAGPDKLSEMCRLYGEQWEDREERLLRFIRHPQLDELTSLTAELQYLATADRPSHLLASIERIKVNIKKIGTAEFFNG